MPPSLAPWIASFSRRWHLLTRAVIAALARLLAPSRCAACDAPSPPLAAFCLACEPPPQTSDPLDSKPRGPFDPAAPLPDLAAGLYEGALARAIRRFKYGARPDLAAPLGERLRRVIERGFVRSDLVIPVPLHPRKLRDRGYNQTALLASAIASTAGARFAPRALERTRDTTAQASLDRAARKSNLDGAFRARDPLEIQGKHVLLVDDVATTGSTLRACADALRRAGASRVTTIVLARRAASRTRAPSAAA